jgi:predicted aspartyl protease
MAYQVDYDGYNGYVRNRAYADIYCHGLGGRVPNPFHLAGLIDTGADYLELPNSVAQQLGLNLSLYSTNLVLTAGGYIPVAIVPNFGVEIEGKLVTVTTHFMALSTALVGLSVIIAAVDIGLDPNRWLYKK